MKRIRGFYFSGVDDQWAGGTVDHVVERRQPLRVTTVITNHYVMVVARSARIDLEPFTIQLPAVQQDRARRVGQRRGNDIVWYDETVPLSDFADEVRSEIAAAHFDSADVQAALRGVLQAFSGRGG